MRLKVGDAIRTSAVLRSGFSNTTIPAGTEGVVIEIYDNPLGYCVDLRIPDLTLVRGARYENVILKPAQLPPAR